MVAHADEMGNVRVLADEGGYKIHPSVVSFHPNGGVVVGAAAKQRKVIDPTNTIYSVKRLIGRAYSSPEVKTAKKRSPFQIKEGANELPLIVTRGGEFAVPEISAIVLDHVRNIAQHQLGEEVSRAVVTVPAAFNDAQRSATATAGAIAGLTVVRVLNEPTAAALAYGNARNLKQTIAVYDFGGGTFDITILKLEDQVYEVLGTAGDTFLGGDDLDERLVDRMVTKFLQENRIDLRTNEVSMMRLRAVAEQTKIELSRRSRAVVRVDEIAYGAKGAPLNLQIEITREEFVSQVADIIDRTFPVCKEALSYARLGIERIDDIILVGGTTKIPYVRDQVSKFFTKAARTDVNPEDAVAVGAALQATSLERILNRKSSQRVSVPITAPVVDDDDAFANETSTVDATVERAFANAIEIEDEETGISQGGPLLQRPSAEVLRPETEYSLPRTGTREVFESKTPPPQGAGAIGRLKPTLPRTTSGNVPAAAPSARTMIVEPPRPPPAPPAANKPRTVPGMPAVQKPPESPWGGPDDFQTSPSLAPTSVEEPPAPPRPPPRGAPPGARTMVHATPPAPTPIAPPPRSKHPSASGPMRLLELERDPPAASTSKGFQPPQAYPVTQQPAPHQMPTMAMQPAPMQQPMPVPPPAYRAPPVVLDVTPRGLGIATVAGFCEELIRRNSRLPAEMVKKFTTSRDQQSAVRIVVCQGESRRMDNNTVIGDLRLEGLPARPRGETSIEVTFALDASGILQVKARDALTGREQHARLDLVGGVQEQDVSAARDRMQQLRR
ncbi:hypothetical protein BH11MYX3_BH11MYX3_27300 [soil metagenome]